MFIQLKLTTSIYKTLEVFKKHIFFLLKKNNLVNLILLSKPVPNKLHKFTFLKAPFIHKTALTQWELKTYQCCYTIRNFSRTDYVKLKHLVTFFYKHLPVLLKLKVVLTRRLFV